MPRPEAENVAGWVRRAILAYPATVRDDRIASQLGVPHMQVTTVRDQARR